MPNSAVHEITNKWPILFFTLAAALDILVYLLPYLPVHYQSFLLAKAPFWAPFRTDFVKTAHDLGAAILLWAQMPRFLGILGAVPATISGIIALKRLTNRLGMRGQDGRVRDKIVVARGHGAINVLVVVVSGWVWLGQRQRRVKDPESGVESKLQMVQTLGFWEAGLQVVLVVVLFQGAELGMMLAGSETRLERDKRKRWEKVILAIVGGLAVVVTGLEYRRSRLERAMEEKLKEM